jgi:hypothetical protein
MLATWKRPDASPRNGTNPKTQAGSGEYSINVLTERVIRSAFSVRRSLNRASRLKESPTEDGQEGETVRLTACFSVLAQLPDCFALPVVGLSPPKAVPPKVFRGSELD